MLIELKNRTIKILGHEYKLEISNKPLLERNTVASVCPNALSIEISDSFPQSRKEEALFHEIIEALNCHLDLKLEHDKLTALSEGLYQVFKDNFQKKEGNLKMCETKKQQIASFYARSQLWWNYKKDNYNDIDTQRDCYEFADDVINILTDGKGLNDD